MKKRYMLYSNSGNDSVAFGDIGYIAEQVNDYYNISSIKPNIKSVLKVLNDQDNLMLLEVVSKHSHISNK